MKKTSVYLAIFVAGCVVGFCVTKYWIVSPKAVMTSVLQWHFLFGISETNAPLDKVAALVWQAVENPRRRSWTIGRTDIQPTLPPPGFPLTPETPPPTQYYLFDETTTEPNKFQERTSQERRRSE